MWITILQPITHIILCTNYTSVEITCTFVHTNSKLSERDIFKNHIYSCTKNNKIFGPMKKFNQGGEKFVYWKLQGINEEEDKNKWKDSPWLWIRIIHIVKLSILQYTNSV